MIDLVSTEGRWLFSPVGEHGTQTEGVRRKVSKETPKGAKILFYGRGLNISALVRISFKTALCILTYFFRLST